MQRPGSEILLQTISHKYFTHFKDNNDLESSTVSVTDTMTTTANQCQETFLQSGWSN
jgi:hypothetical protein